MTKIEENTKRLAEKRGEIIEAVNRFNSFFEVQKCMSSLLGTFGENLRMYALIETLQRKGKFTEDDMPYELPCWNWINDTFFTLSEVVQFMATIQELDNDVRALNHLAAGVIEANK